MVDAVGPPFVGRAAELDRIAALFQRTAAGDPAVCIVGGEAGVGKSRLVAEFAKRARATGGRVLEGACLELADGGLPYAPFVEILRDLIHGLEPGEVARLLGPGRSELGRLVPELDSGPQHERHGVDTRQQAQARLFELVLGVFERLGSQGPVVLVVEDLHWADRSTRDLLAFLVRGLRDDPVLIVVTARTDEIADRQPILSYLAELGRIDRVERIELGPLGRSEVAALVRSAVGGPPADGLLDALLARTDGNPFFVEQLLATRTAPGGAQGSVTELPPRLRDVLAARIGGLSERARGVLRAAAAGGWSVDDRLLGEVVDLPPRALDEALREAVEHQILVRVPDGRGGRALGPGGRDVGLADRGDESEGAYAFRHALLQEVVLGELFPGERRRLHAAYAVALTRRVADDGDGAGGPSPVELAYHWDAAHDWRRALPLTIEAGYAAERAFAFAEAFQHYERALELWERVPDADSLFLGDRASLLERAAEMAVLNGEYPRAVELGRAAVAAIPEGIDDARRGLFHERLRWFLWEAGDRAAAESALEAAAALVPDAPPSAARARVLGHLAGLHMFAGRYGDSQREATAALPHARAVGARTEEAMALGVLGWDTALLGDVDGGVADLRQALGIAQDVGSIEGIALGYATLASLLDLVGRANEAVELARQGRLAVAKFGVARTYGGLLVASEASALLAVGRWDEARDILAESLERATTSRASIALHLQAGRLETAAGHFAEAADHLTRARAGDEAAGGSDQRVAILAAVAELAAWQGRSADVRAAATEGLAGLPEVPEPAHAWLAAFGIRGEADAAVRARARRADDEVAEAIRWGDELAGTLASFSGRAGEVLAARYAVVAALGAAERARLQANPDPGAWLAAAEGFEAMERPYPAAYARYREAEARLAAREGRAAAEQPLRRAWSAARDLGAGALAAEVSTLARQARIDLEPSGVRGPGRAGDHGSEATVHPAALDRFGLTDRELEVLRLVAGGWTNRQIAEALFISRKTASVHVSNILGKLEVDGRVEAAAIAHRLGLGADAPPPPDAVRPEAT